MNREIKYRAFDLAKKEYQISGSVLIGSEGEPFSLMPIKNGGYSVQLRENIIIEFFVGRQDEKRKDIYEGDIIKFLLPPKELEHDSSENMFGTEPQNSWQECTKVTEPILATAEVFYDNENISYGLRNIKCYVLNEIDEEYYLADPEEIGGGADGFETVINPFYENWIDFTIDSMLYDVWVSDFIEIEVIGNIHQNRELL